MSILLTKKLADAICTVVTLGFMEKMSADTGAKTHFGYIPDAGKEEAEKASYSLLENRINSIKPIVSFELIRYKETQPLVLAQTNKVTLDNINEIADVVSHRAALLEAIANARKNNFYGAYISGIISSDNGIKLSQTSSLKLYSRPEGEWIMEGLSNETVRKSYKQAWIMTDATNAFLSENATKYNAGHKVRITLEKDDIEKPPYFEDDKLFGSVHGLVRAIITYGLTKSGIYSDSYATCCELALSAQTNKVASCIPCSIFAASNGTPAAYTHLGRGDNWNFPNPNSDGTFNDNLEKKKNAWVDYVCECFGQGYDLIKNRIPDCLEDLHKIMNFANTPKSEIFLHSLTFEGSFRQRIDSTLELLSIPNRKN